MIMDTNSDDETTTSTSEQQINQKEDERPEPNDPKTNPLPRSHQSLRYS